MKDYSTTSTNASDLKTLIGESLSNEYTFQMQQAELADLAAEDEREDWPGYGEWSEDVEQAVFEQSQDEQKQAETPDGPIYISRECNYTECKTSRCDKGLRIGGFDL